MAIIQLFQFIIKYFLRFVMEEMRQVRRWDFKHPQTIRCAIHLQELLLKKCIFSNFFLRKNKVKGNEVKIKIVQIV